MSSTHLPPSLPTFNFSLTSSSPTFSLRLIRIPLPLRRTPTLRLWLHGLSWDGRHRVGESVSSSISATFLLSSSSSRRSSFLTFSFSALLDCSHLFTDGRYYLQARSEMDENWALMKLGLPGSFHHLLPSSLPSALSRRPDSHLSSRIPRSAETPTHLQYLTSLGTSSSNSSRVGVPSHLIPLADFNSLRSQGVNIEGTDDLVGMVWNEEGGRGKRAEGAIRVLGVEYSGEFGRRRGERRRVSFGRTSLR